MSKSKHSEAQTIAALKQLGTISKRIGLNQLPPLASLPLSGANVSAADIVQFVPWQPSQCPPAPTNNHEFVVILKRIFEQSMLIEIKKRNRRRAPGMVMLNIAVTSLRSRCSVPLTRPFR